MLAQGPTLVGAKLLTDGHMNISHCFRLGNLDYSKMCQQKCFDKTNMVWIWVTWSIFRHLS